MKSENKGAGVPEKSRKISIGLVIAAIALVALIAYVLIGPKTVIDVSDCYSITFSGADGSGEAVAHCDGTAIYDQIVDGLSKKSHISFVSNGTSAGEKMDIDVFNLVSSFEPNMDKGNGLSNGDKVELSLTYDEDLANELRIKFIHTEKTVEVSGLETSDMENEDIYFPTDENGYPRNDVLMINGVQYDIDFSERSKIIEVHDANETLEIILPRNLLSAVWNPQYESAILEEYKRIEMDSDSSIIGISNVVDKYVFEISEDTNFIRFNLIDEASADSSSLFQLSVHINAVNNA